MSKSVRFIHSSDWQLGMTRSFLTAEADARFGQARIDAIGKLGEAAREHDAAFIIVAGDVFESNQLSKQTVARTIDALARLPVPIFLLPGNHDPLDAASIFSTDAFAAVGEHVHVLRDMQPVAVPGLNNVEVVGAPWRTKHPSSDLCQDLANTLSPADGCVRIAVAHGQVDTLSPDASRPDIINLAALEQALAAGKFHYAGLGDRHSLTEVGESGRVWYSGAPVATAFRENEPNKALLVELSDSECTVSPLEIGNWQFVQAQREINEQSDLDEFAQWLEAIENKACTAVKVGFTGTANLATAARLDQLMLDKAALFASLQRRERTSDLAIMPDEFDQDSAGLSGYAKAAWDELLASASGDDEAARDALRLFYRLSAQGGER